MHRITINWMLLILITMFSVTFSANATDHKTKHHHKHHHKKHCRPHHKYHHWQKCYFILKFEHEAHLIAHDVKKGSKAIKHAAVKSTKGVAHGVKIGSKAIKHAAVKSTKGVAHGVKIGSKAIKHAVVKTTKALAHVTKRELKHVKAVAAKARKDIHKLRDIDKLANKAIMHGIAHPKQFLHKARKFAESELNKSKLEAKHLEKQAKACAQHAKKCAKDEAKRIAKDIMIAGFETIRWTMNKADPSRLSPNYRLKTASASLKPNTLSASSDSTPNHESAKQLKVKNDKRRLKAARLSLKASNAAMEFVILKYSNTIVNGMFYAIKNISKPEKAVEETITEREVWCNDLIYSEEFAANLGDEFAGIPEMVALGTSAWQESICMDGTRIAIVNLFKFLQSDGVNAIFIESKALAQVIIIPVGFANAAVTSIIWNVPYKKVSAI